MLASASADALDHRLPGRERDRVRRTGESGGLCSDGRAVMTSGGLAGDEAARWAAVARVRADHPRWVVIWSSLRGEFQARPLFRAPRDTVAAGLTPEDLVAQMTAIRAAAPRRAVVLPGRSPVPAGCKIGSEGC